MGKWEESPLVRDESRAATLRGILNAYGCTSAQANRAVARHYAYRPGLVVDVLTAHVVAYFAATRTLIPEDRIIAGDNREFEMLAESCADALWGSILDYHNAGWALTNELDYDLTMFFASCTHEVLSMVPIRLETTFCFKDELDKLPEEERVARLSVAAQLVQHVLRRAKALPERIEDQERVCVGLVNQVFEAFDRPNETLERLRKEEAKHAMD